MSRPVFLGQGPRISEKLSLILWVPTTHPTRSCNESVLVNEAAEDLIST